MEADILKLPTVEELSHLIIPEKKKNKKSKKSKKIPKLKFLYLIAALIMITIIAISGYHSKIRAEKLISSCKNHLENINLELEKGDTAAALTEAGKANDEIRQLKLLAQSWGQDISYLRLLDTNSKYVAMERLLDGAYLVLNTTANFDKEIIKLSGKDMSGLEYSAKGSKIMFNLASSRSELFASIQKAKENIADGRKELILAKKGLGPDWQGQVDKTIEMLDGAIISIDFASRILTKDLAWLSGENGEERNILILFQNNGELRGGTGGSLGSFGVAKFSNGYLQGIDFGQNIYKIDNPYRSKSTFETPEDLDLLVGSKLTMKDSGWALDSPEAFSKIYELYKAETGKNIDGAFMIDTSAIVDLMEVTGPIELSSYDKTFNSSNLRAELEYESHAGYFEKAGSQTENEPKKILSDLMPVFMDRLFGSLGDESKATKLISVFSKEAKEKHILFNFKNVNFQTRLNKLNLTGRIPAVIGDYLYINNSNINGAKSSLSVLETVNLTVNIGEDGKVKNDLSLKRTHQGINVLPDGVNQNFVRMLLPKNSKILSFNPVSGDFLPYNQSQYKNDSPFYQAEEAGKTKIAFWMSTKPGEESNSEISYEPNITLDTSADFSYEMLLQKQPGSNSDKIKLSIISPEGFEPLDVENFDSKQRKSTIEFVLNSDRVVKVFFHKIAH